MSNVSTVRAFALAHAEHALEQRSVERVFTRYAVEVSPSGDVSIIDVEGQVVEETISDRLYCPSCGDSVEI